LPNARAS